MARVGPQRHRKRKIVVLDDCLLINQLIGENDRYRSMLPILPCTRTVAEVLK